jgi:dienelactone hydrolase
MTESRTLEDGKDWLLQRLERGIHPVDEVDPDVARATIGSLEGLDPEAWTGAWGAAAERFAADAEAADDPASEREAWLQAYRFAFIARYPTLNHPLKREWYARTREYFVKAGELDHPALQVVTIPFDSRDGEGSELHFYVARPPGVERPPVVMTWGGIDTWKEEMRSRASYLLDLGFAMLLVDMPGIGQSPVLASPDAERQWTPVFDWVAAQDDLDGDRVAVLGASFGGYWAMKLAYTHRERLRAAVNWGGGVHITFTREWQEKSRNAASYLMDLMAARAAIFGGKTFEDYVARCPELSLLDQGLLDEPSAPLLLVNGRHDLQNATDDIYLSLEHGDPKTARIFPGGHMGEGPTVPTIGDWLRERLA